MSISAVDQLHEFATKRRWFVRRHHRIAAELVLQELKQTQEAVEQAANVAAAVSRLHKETQTKLAEAQKDAKDFQDQCDAIGITIWSG